MSKIRRAWRELCESRVSTRRGPSPGSVLVYERSDGVRVYRLEERPARKRK